MELLIATQKMDRDDPILGFFHRWVEEFSKHCLKITVICLEEGKHNLPSNVKVLSLGKEEGRGRLTNVVRFWKYIWRERRNYDKVFVHMNPEYVVLGGVCWKIWGKKIGLWYTHKEVNLKLIVAEKLAHIIFTASPQSFRLKSTKLKIMGHGIDIKKFSEFKFKEFDKRTDIKILHVGRVAPIKKIEVLIEAANRLKNDGVENFQIILVGEPVVSSDHEYMSNLKDLIEKYDLPDRVEFVGSVPNREIGRYYELAHVSVNMTPTGGLDKAVLESMAASTPAFSSNDSFIGFFGKHRDIFHFKFENPADLSKKILKFIDRNDKKEMAESLRKAVSQKAGLENLAERLTKCLEG